MNGFIRALNWNRPERMMICGIQHSSSCVEKEKCMVFCGCIGQKRFWNGPRVQRKHWPMQFILMINSAWMDAIQAVMLVS